jgi:cytochrome c biogenesis factor
MFCEANPFAIHSQTIVEFQGTSPLLYDRNMVWHPPMYYIGTAFLFIPFAFSLDPSFLINRTADVLWWIRLSFTMLTFALLGGSMWAFYQLGWGGFWFWDPVECVSLFPWILCLMYVHIPVNTRIHVPALGGLPFLGVLLQIFFVRSGLLTSVHSFAHDTIAACIFGFLCAAMTWVLIRTHHERRLSLMQLPLPWFIKVAVGVMAGIFCIILVGVTLPLIFSFTLHASFFNHALAPLALSLLGGIIFYPFHVHKDQWPKPLIYGLTALFIFLYSRQGFNMYLGCFGAIASFACGVSCSLYRILFKTCLAHTGYGLMIIGLVMYAQFSTENNIILGLNETTMVQDLHISHENTYKDENPFLSTHHYVIHIKNAGHHITLHPAHLFFHPQRVQRVKAAYGRMGMKIVLISNIETHNNRLIVTLHHTSGLILTLIGAICIGLATLRRRT